MIGRNVIIDILKDQFLRFGAFVGEGKLSKRPAVNHNKTQKTKIGGVFFLPFYTRMSC